MVNKDCLIFWRQALKLQNSSDADYYEANHISLLHCLPHAADPPVRAFFLCLTEIPYVTECLCRVAAHKAVQSALTVA